MDGFKSTIALKVSTDAVTWTQIGDIIPYTDYVVETIRRAAGGVCQLQRRRYHGPLYQVFRSRQAMETGYRSYEVLYNKTVSNIGDDAVTLAEASFAADNLANLYDGDLTTAVTSNSVGAGDTLNVQMTSITDVGSLTIVQDADHICGAVVSVKTLDGSWTEVGSLDEQVNIFDVSKTITGREIKL